MEANRGHHLMKWKTITRLKVCPVDFVVNKNVCFMNVIYSSTLQFWTNRFAAYHSVGLDKYKAVSFELVFLCCGLSWKLKGRL